jgi:regulator of sirC expression with transglutaminase-like and TPR domain
MNTHEQFNQELTYEPDKINLACAALLLARYLSDTEDTPAYYLALLDDMAEAVRPAIRTAPTGLAAIAALNHYLFTELRFYGNTTHYYDPNNSFLNKVLDLKTGIPISLSVVYLELGWRLGLPLSGVGLPGHFIIRYDLPGAPIFVDVFNQGRVLTEDDCLALCQAPLVDRALLRNEYLRPVGKKAILFRLLLNLKQIYLRQEAWELAHRTIDLMLLVRPHEVDEIRDRGLVAYRLNRLRQASFDLQRYLYLNPNAPDANWLRQHLDMLEEKLSRLN